MTRVIVHKRAAKYLRKLPAPDKERIKETLKQLEEKTDLPGIKAMAGDWTGYYRLRIGNFRVIFWIEETDDIIYVDHIGSRGDIYK